MASESADDSDVSESNEEGNEEGNEESEEGCGDETAHLELESVSMDDEPKKRTTAPQDRR